RCHVLWRSKGGLRIRQGRRIFWRSDNEELRDAEIQNLDRSRLGAAFHQKQIRGFYVAMNDAEAMRFGERFARLERVLAGDPRIEGSALFKERFEILSFEKIHHDVRSAAFQTTDVEDANGVRARKT